MTAPTFDQHGYPTDETLAAIRTWPTNDLPGLLEFMRDAWHDKYGKVERDGPRYRFVTGGWSGNETLLGALQCNLVAWLMMWQMSARGSVFELALPDADTTEGA